MKTITIDEAIKQLARMKDIYRFIKDENNKPDHSVLTIIGKKFHDENAISDYLAYVLDPQINGVGYQPLYHFLKIIGHSIELSEKDQIDVQREYVLPNNRRIDFLITINKESIVAIEHKVFSEEHGDQTWDYEKEINKAFQETIDNVTYVFLTPNGKKPLNPAFVPISYYQLVSALKNVNVNFIADIRKAVLYNEMIFHLEGYFLDNRSIALSNKASLYLNHHEMIQDLREQFEQDYYRIFQYIESIFKNYFIQKLEGDWEFDFKKDRTYHQIYKSHWKRKELNIHFELNLSHNSLINHSLSIMLDIEGTKWEAFKNGYDKKLKEQLNDLFSNHQILYRKGKRGQTFAYKNYHFLTPHHLEDEEIIHQHLIEMIEEFIGMVGPVDQAIERFYHNSC